MRRIQFVSDHLVDQIIDGRKTASVANVGDIDTDEDDYNSALVVGDYYEVFDSFQKKRAVIRIVAMELCRWEDIPERLWRGETNLDEKEFRMDHEEFFHFPGEGFEFIAYYFTLVERCSQ